MNTAIKTLVRFYNDLNEEFGSNESWKKSLIEAIDSIDDVDSIDVELSFNDEGRCSLPNIALTRAEWVCVNTGHNPIFDDMPIKEGDIPHRARITTELPKCYWKKLLTEYKGDKAMEDKAESRYVHVQHTAGGETKGVSSSSSERIEDKRPLFTADGRPIHVQTPATKVTWKSLSQAINEGENDL
tara:strand:+ start:17775 stop:18329 length:555 start_codon:yes stop_codon:yes gene_type:complete